MTSQAFWLLARCAIVAANMWIAFSQSDGPINADWRVGLLGGVLGALGFYVWFGLRRYAPDVVLTDNFSLTEPFWPFNKYPIRSWLLGAAAATFAGTLGVVYQLFVGQLNPMPGIMVGFSAPLLCLMTYLAIKEAPQASSKMG